MKKTTSPSELLLTVRRDDRRGLRDQLESGLRSAIQLGRLPGGSRLPSSRALASDLGVSRGVAVLAYEQLIAEGYLVAARGSATRVALTTLPSPPGTAAQDLTPAPRYDFRPGLPDASIFPRRAWLSALRRVLASAELDAALGYPDPAGAYTARAALAAYLNRTRATVARADRMVLCTGFAQGLRLACAVLRDRGVTHMAVEDPGHGGQRADVVSMGLRVASIPVDRGGLRVDQLERTKARAVLVTPAHQFPTGVVMAPERRQALLDWAARRDAVILEDDYDAEYRFDREPVGALQGLAERRVVYLGSISKTLAPALRIGWLLLPAPLVDRVALAKLHADHGSPTIDQLALADFIARGGLDRHLRRARQLYRRRRDVMMAALRTHLPGVTVEGVAAGLQLMLTLPATADEAAIVAAAARRSLRVYGVRPHRLRAGAPALLLGYASVPERAIRAGVALLARCLAEPADRAAAAADRFTHIWDPTERLLVARTAAAAGGHSSVE